VTQDETIDCLHRIVPCSYCHEPLSFSQQALHRQTNCPLRPVGLCRQGCGSYNYVTPTSFLELSRFYRLLLSHKRATQIHKIKRLAVGLTTLKKTALNVAELHEELKNGIEKSRRTKKSDRSLVGTDGQTTGRCRDETETSRSRTPKRRVRPRWPRPLKHKLVSNWPLPN
jgi:hypothetical protein